MTSLPGIGDLSDGQHTFRVRAHDSVGWDLTPAKWTWKIVR